MACEMIETPATISQERERIKAICELILVETTEPMTVRQVFYRAVGLGKIPNTRAYYSKIQRMLRDGRKWGWFDWDRIVDHSRAVLLPPAWASVPHALDTMANLYRTDWWIDQDNLVELWVEKVAAGAYLRKLAARYHVRLIMGAGFSSWSVLRAARDRFVESDRPAKILYVGDFDLSGAFMVQEDLPNRLDALGIYAEIVLVALTEEQIAAHNLPENIAWAEIKQDPRRAWYRKTYPHLIQPGKAEKQWEVDALDPNALRAAVEEAILVSITDPTSFEAVKRDDERGSARIAEIATSEERR